VAFIIALRGGVNVLSDVNGAHQRWHRGSNNMANITPWTRHVCGSRALPSPCYSKLLRGCIAHLRADDAHVARSQVPCINNIDPWRVWLTTT